MKAARATAKRSAKPAKAPAKRAVPKKSTHTRPRNSPVRKETATRKTSSPVRRVAAPVPKAEVVTASSLAKAPAAKAAALSSREKAAISLGGLGWIGLGLLGIYVLVHSKEAKAQESKNALPLPQTPEQPEQPGAPAPAPAPAPAAPEEPVPFWSPDGKTLNSLTGYHRAKKSEVGPQIVALSSSFLKFPVGTIHFVKADGRDYAVAIEGSHNNHPEIGPTNKGVSLYVKDPQ